MQIVYTGGGPAANRLVLLATSTPATEIAPGGLGAAPGRAEETPLWREVRASKFQVADVPSFVPRQTAEILRRSLGVFWVVPWYRNTACALESSWLGQSMNRGFRAVLFLSPRPESLWVNGEPTFDSFDDFSGPRAMWETDATNPKPTSLRDLKIFLAVYPRLSAFSPWREGSLLAWGLAHRDSGNVPGVRERLQELMSAHVGDSLSAAGFPFAGDWQAEGALADGDSLRFWMRIASRPARYVWSGMGSYYGIARFDSIPLPTSYDAHVAYAKDRESLPSGRANMAEQMGLPFNAVDTLRSSGSWGFLARFAPASRRSALTLQDAAQGLPTTLLGKTRPIWLSQSLRINARRDTISVVITSRDSAVAHWTARRVP